MAPRVFLVAILAALEVTVDEVPDARVVALAAALALRRPAPRPQVDAPASSRRTAGL